MRDRFALIHDELEDLGVETDAIASRTPASTLAETAETDQAQVIVVGSSHRGPVGRTLAGSVGESLLQGASRAVAIAPRGYAERDEERLQRIAVAFDGSSESWAALETAIGLAERCSCDRHGDHRRRPPQVRVRRSLEHPRRGRVSRRRARGQGARAGTRGQPDPEGTRAREPCLDRRSSRSSDRGERRVRPDGRRLPCLGPAQADASGQHHAKADPLLRVPGSGPAARGRRRPARCPSWPGRRTRVVLRLLHSPAAARRAARGPRSLDVGATRAARASARGDPPGPLPLRPFSREGGARPRR